MGNCSGKKAQKPKAEKPTKQEKVQPTPVTVEAKKVSEKQAAAAAAAADQKEEALRSTPVVKEEPKEEEKPATEKQNQPELHELLAMATNAVVNMDNQHELEKAERDTYYTERT